MIIGVEPEDKVIESDEVGSGRGRMLVSRRTVTMSPSCSNRTSVEDRKLLEFDS